MNFNEIIDSLKSFEGTEEFETYVSGLMNADRVGKYLDTEDGKKYINPKMDKHFSTSLETWKKNNLDALVDAKVKELYPEADPKDKKVAELQAELEKIKADNLRKDLKNKALTFATEKGLPVDLVDFFIGTDEKTTIANMETLEKTYTAAIANAVRGKLKGDNYAPPADDGDPIDGVTAAFRKLNPDLYT